MPRHVATFDIGSETDAHAVRLLTEKIHDTLREELKRTGRDDEALERTLGNLAAIRDAAREPSSGTLTIVYESLEEPLVDRSDDG